MKRLLFGCTMSLGGIIGAAGISSAYSSTITDFVIKDVFDTSKIDGSVLMGCIGIAVCGAVLSLIALKRNDEC